MIKTREEPDLIMIMIMIMMMIIIIIIIITRPARGIEDECRKMSVVKQRRRSETIELQSCVNEARKRANKSNRNGANA